MSAKPAQDFMLTRRLVLQGMAAALATSVLPACSWWLEDDHDALPEVRVKLGSVVRRYFSSDIEAASRVGEAWLSRFDSDAQVREDLEKTFTSLANIWTTGGMVRALEAAVINDFETLCMVTLNGWQLSITEVRVAAVARLVG